MTHLMYFILNTAYVFLYLYNFFEHSRVEQVAENVKTEEANNKNTGHHIDDKIYQR